MVVAEKGLEMELAMPSAEFEVVIINYCCPAFSVVKKISSLANDYIY